MSPVQLVDLGYMNKHELPMPKPLPDFSTPVLVMVGDQDVVVDVEAARETAQHFGQAEAVELQGVAHDLMLVSIYSGIQTHCCSKSWLLLTLAWHHSVAAVIPEGISKQLKEYVILCNDWYFGSFSQVYLWLCRTRNGPQLLKLSLIGCAACSCTCIMYRMTSFSRALITSTTR